MAASSSTDPAQILSSLALMLEQQAEELEAQSRGQDGLGSRGRLEARGKDRGKGGRRTSYLSACCPDPHCHTKLFFPSHEVSVECAGCGQRHSVRDLAEKKEVWDREARIGVEMTQLRQKRRTPELVRVKGISNYQCKLLSPLLTTHGMDNRNEAKPLLELKMGETFDCSKLADRAFSIEETYLETMGYGRDRSGSVRYLGDTLLALMSGDRECLVPIHADGDGHCLVHAISRCLVGRELFWHALRTNLHSHLLTYQDRYKSTFKDFVGEDEWPSIIAEASPDFQPPDGQDLGLRNIHIFGLANVLRRPIVLLDSLEGMKSSGDYSGIFLPALHTTAECSSKNGQVNSPITIAWSNSGRNHFIPLVPIRGRPLPKFPSTPRIKVWGPWSEPEQLLRKYVAMDATGAIELCRGKPLSDGYLQKLVSCMETLFSERHGVAPSLVSEVNTYVFKNSGYVNVHADFVIDTTVRSTAERRLYRCLLCSGLSCVPLDWLQPGGRLYSTAEENIGLRDEQCYKFPFDGINAVYNASADCLEVWSTNCFLCSSMTRPVLVDGKTEYQNGDRTTVPAVGSKCRCGFRHYWDGNEYDNLPEKIPLKLTWGGRAVQVAVYWFQYESDAERNSNAYEVAQKLVIDNFPGEFGSERLVQQVVDQILASTEHMENAEQVSGYHPPVQEGKSPTDTAAPQTAAVAPAVAAAPPDKMIMTGQKSKTLHKEELTMSEAEKTVRKRIEDNAAARQSRQRSPHAARKTTPTSKAPPRVSPPPPSPHATPTTPLSPHPPTATATPPSPPPQANKPTTKRIRVSTSDGRTANLSLDPATTFSQLQTAIEAEFQISPEFQKLRSGYPPKELKMISDPSVPVDLANGDRVSVEVIGVKPRDQNVSAKPPHEDPAAMDTASDKESETIDTFIKALTGGTGDLWTLAQHQPQLFQKGGDYYDQVIQQYGGGGSLRDHAHLQFKQFPNKVFSYNAQEERLEVCLGADHVPVAPLTPHQEMLATASAKLSNDVSGSSSAEAVPLDDVAMGMGGHSGSVHKAVPSVKAFSGKGHTLSSSGGDEGQGSLLEAAQRVVEKRLLALQARERELKEQVHSLNRQMVHADANQDGASVQDDVLTDVETRLLDSSSELKKVREEIRELTTLH